MLKKVSKRTQLMAARMRTEKRVKEFPMLVASHEIEATNPNVVPAIQFRLAVLGRSVEVSLKGVPVSAPDGAFDEAVAKKRARLTTSQPATIKTVMPLIFGLRYVDMKFSWLRCGDCLAPTTSH